MKRDNKKMNIKLKFSLGIILLVIFFFGIIWFVRKDSICDEYNIYFKSDIASAIFDKGKRSQEAV